VTSVINNTQ